MMSQERETKKGGGSSGEQEIIFGTKMRAKFFYGNAEDSIGDKLIT